MPSVIPAVPLLDSPPARRRARTASALAILSVAVVDWKVAQNLSLGFLYIFPILVLALFIPRGAIVTVAAASAVLRELLSPPPLDAGSPARILMGLVAFGGAGLFVSELARNRRLALEHAAALRQQSELREEVQEQLRVLVESSPAAILTLDAHARVLLAHEAAHRLLSFEGHSLTGESLAPLLPALASALERQSSSLRTNMECVGRRRDGEVFLAHVWFSTYRSHGGQRLAAIVLDVSDELRDREVQSLGSVAAASRVLFGAVSHEVRNLAAAAAVAPANLARDQRLADSDDFKALGALVGGLERIAYSDLRFSTQLRADSVDLGNVLDELRIVLEPSFREEGMSLEWSIPAQLPSVLAEPQSLLRIFLNLAQNSQRAMAQVADRRLRVSVEDAGDGVVVRFEDTGAGVAQPAQLFRPFQHGNGGSGLGLYVSRTIAQSFAGDLLYEPRPQGSCFAVRLAVDRGGAAADA